MTADTGEPPSTGQHDASPGTSPYRPAATEKPWRPANIFASFGHAFDGVRETFRAERNFRFHVLASLLVLVAGFSLHISPLRIVAVFFAIALVIVTELINTALEVTVDLAMPAHHPLAKRAKDASAGAVLIAAICAVVVGAIVFLPALMPYVSKLPPSAIVPPGVFILAAVSFALLRKRRRLNAAGPSSDLSRKVVIGVALLAYAGYCACELAVVAQRVVTPEIQPSVASPESPHLIVLFRAGVP
ncbi:MAG: diacylglycerol kinase family protein [Akkermansiaceae bacterium]|nr:diacylglycerol kinase family protein [Armatimonadota bacterium]